MISDPTLCAACGHHNVFHAEGPCSKVTVTRASGEYRCCACKGFVYTLNQKPPLERIPIALAPYGQTIAVVCNDGTAFSLNGKTWVPLPSIPQP